MDFVAIDFETVDEIQFMQMLNAPEGYVRYLLVRGVS
jgi:hypothetical protein